MEGERKYIEYPVKYTFYVEDKKGKHKSIYGDPLLELYVKAQKTLERNLCIKIAVYLRLTSIQNSKCLVKTIQI